MLLTHLFESLKFDLFEAKARIEHPEDLIFDHGLNGAYTALNILQATAAQPQSVSIKMDGSPSLIFGWRGDEFVLTDKAGFSAKGYDGMTTTPEDIESMIAGRKIKDASPEARAARQAYASKIAGLYEILRAATPRSFKGFAQGDLLWTQTPPVADGAYEFKPVKIRYRVPVDSELAQRIKRSHVGMVIHSVYDSQEDSEPRALRDPKRLGFREVDGLAIVPHEVKFRTPLRLDAGLEERLESLLKQEGDAIGEFFNASNLTSAGIRALPGAMKSWLAHKAKTGSSDLDHAPEEFLDWLTTPASKITAKMMPRILDYVKAHLAGYNAAWQVVQLIVALKLDLKRQMDQQVSGTLSASLRDTPGHEGFVSVTPHGIIKLVQRAEFMQAQPEALTEDDPPSTPGPHVAWTFIRANPPTLGHQMVVGQTAKAARGGDYWVFLSHSQDPKKNPLDWATKLEFAKELMPQHAAHMSNQSTVRTPLQAADWLYDQGYRSMTMVVGSDRVQVMKDLLTSWNSPEIRAKSNRDPVAIQVVSAGERDPDAEGIAGISGTRARLAVTKGDRDDFELATGVKGNLADRLFDAVGAGMKLKQAVKEDDHAQDHPHGTIVMLSPTRESALKLARWCLLHNIKCMRPEDLHVTVLYSRVPMPKLLSMHGNQIKLRAKIKGWRLLGTNALTLELDSPTLSSFHKHLRSLGGSHDFEQYLPHISVVYGYEGEIPHMVPEFELAFDGIDVGAIDPNYAAKVS